MTHARGPEPATGLVLNSRRASIKLKEQENRNRSRISGANNLQHQARASQGSADTSQLLNVPRHQGQGVTGSAAHLLLRSGSDAQGRAESGAQLLPDLSRSMPGARLVSQNVQQQNGAVSTASNLDVHMRGTNNGGSNSSSPTGGLRTSHNLLHQRQALQALRQQRHSAQQQQQQQPVNTSGIGHRAVMQERALQLPPLDARQGHTQSQGSSLPARARRPPALSVPEGLSQGQNSIQVLPVLPDRRFNSAQHNSHGGHAPGSLLGSIHPQPQERPQPHSISAESSPSSIDIAQLIRLAMAGQASNQSLTHHQCQPLSPLQANQSSQLILHTSSNTHPLLAHQIPGEPPSPRRQQNSSPRALTPPHGQSLGHCQSIDSVDTPTTLFQGVYGINWPPLIDTAGVRVSSSACSSSSGSTSRPGTGSSSRAGLSTSSSMQRGSSMMVHHSDRLTRISSGLLVQGVAQQPQLRNQQLQQQQQWWWSGSSNVPSPHNQASSNASGYVYQAGSRQQSGGPSSSRHQPQPVQSIRHAPVHPALQVVGNSPRAVGLDQLQGQGQGSTHVGRPHSNCSSCSSASYYSAHGSAGYDAMHQAIGGNGNLLDSHMGFMLHNPSSAMRSMDASGMGSVREEEEFMTDHQGGEEELPAQSSRHYHGSGFHLHSTDDEGDDPESPISTDLHYCRGVREGDEVGFQHQPYLLSRASDRELYFSNGGEDEDDGPGSTNTRVAEQNWSHGAAGVSALPVVRQLNNDSNNLLEQYGNGHGFEGQDNSVQQVGGSGGHFSRLPPLGPYQPQMPHLDHQNQGLTGRSHYLITPPGRLHHPQLPHLMHHQLMASQSSLARDLLPSRGSSDPHFGLGYMLSPHHQLPGSLGSNLQLRPSLQQWTQQAARMLLPHNMRDMADLLMGDGWRPGLADALPSLTTQQGQEGRSHDSRQQEDNRHRAYERAPMPPQGSASLSPSHCMFSKMGTGRINEELISVSKEVTSSELLEGKIPLAHVRSLMADSDSVSRLLGSLPGVDPQSVCIQVAVAALAGQSVPAAWLPNVEPLATW